MTNPFPNPRYPILLKEIDLIDSTIMAGRRGVGEFPGL